MNDATVILFVVLSILGVGGAIMAVTTREVIRLAVGLGAFLLALAGFFALFGAGLLAVAEIFLYVGGVLVLLLFALMLVRRTNVGRPAVESHRLLSSALAALAFTAALIVVLTPLADALAMPQGVTDPTEIAESLLGPLLVPFEIAGVLLLAALAAVVALTGGGDE